MRIAEGLDRITFEPLVMGGKPCIRGMRVKKVNKVAGLVFFWISSER
jgi:uncharacterized protein (DUF433 family)